jgi:hypothetical protein
VDDVVGSIRPAGLRWKIRLEETTVTVAGDVADATTVSVPSPSGHVTAGLCEAFEKLTRIDIAGVEPKCQFQKSRVRLAWERHGCRVESLCGAG